MSAFIYSVTLQWKLDIRDKGVLLVYYGAPLMFVLIAGGVFNAAMPEMNLMASLTVFSVTMGGLMGASGQLQDRYRSDVKRAYIVGGVPLYMGALVNFISAFIHLMIMSLIIYFITPLLFGAATPANIAGYFLALSVLIAALLGISTMLGLVIKNSDKLTMITQMIFLVSVFLSGIMLPAGILPEMLDQVGLLLPATWGFLLMNGVDLTMYDWVPLLGIIVVSLGASVIQLSRLRSE